MTTTIHHDVRDRRRTNMEDACQKLANCVADLHAFAGDPKLVAGVAYSVADRLSRLIVELEAFKARDLISMRAVNA
jgi:hypothetical protein